MRGTGVVARGKPFVYSTEKVREPASNSAQQIRNYAPAINAEHTLQRPLRNPIALVYVLRTVFEKTAIDWFSHH